MNQPCCSEWWKSFATAFVLAALAAGLAWGGILFTIWLIKPEIMNQHMLLLTVVGPSSILLAAVLHAFNQLHSKPVRSGSQ
ncbi:MAG: hypothetical protein E2591_27435 [Achromobacter sp.]|uniref:hypothetical protein n=1 Tax=Achromobacter sp. TaxID=134375 RepID=UPI0012BED069|nr:hypothetical protein [Achromobacter sp.]MPS81805.1 hypothetical protein [Achromobacter sp.]